MRIFSFGKLIITSTPGKLSEENYFISVLLLESHVPTNDKPTIPPVVINKPHTLHTWIGMLTCRVFPLYQL